MPSIKRKLTIINRLVQSVNNLQDLAMGFWSKLQRQEFIEFGLQSLILQHTIQHLYGPRHISYDSDELLLICLVRNGELYIKSFIEHHFSLGVKHIVFLDNISTDRTVEMLCSYENVTVLQSHLPHKIYENTMRRYLAERFAKNRWCLACDIDELFDYPDSSRLKLGDFLTYLEHHQYTAVLVQMLDMFSEIPLAYVNSQINDDLKLKYRNYDISAIEKKEYWWVTPENDKIMMHMGGIRKTFFGTNNALTKAALIKIDGSLKSFVDCSHVKNARLADISCLLNHYCFLSSFYTKVQDAVQAKRYVYLAHQEYEAYWQVLEKNPALNLKLETAQKLSNLEELIEQDFLIVSDSYRQWVECWKQVPSQQSASELGLTMV